MRWMPAVLLATALAAAGIAAADPAPVDVAVPYTAPAQPPQQAGPLTIRPSRDAHARLDRVRTGTLVDSGAFHDASMRTDKPMTPDGQRIAFQTPSGAIGCNGSVDWLICVAGGGRLPMPPKPVHAPIGNWEPYLELDGKGLTYGVAAGNPLVPAQAATLPYGSTLRFGDTECLSAREGITCANLPSGTGFQLSRDELTPLRAIEPLQPDARVEPRTPGNRYCGAVVTRAAVRAAITTLAGGAQDWEPVGPGDYYTCNDLQLFQAGYHGTRRTSLPAMPTRLLLFDRGRFVSGVTDRSYPWLTGAVDDADPTLIHLDFRLPDGSTPAKADLRARYADGRVTLLDPIPPGAVAGP